MVQRAQKDIAKEPRKGLLWLSTCMGLKKPPTRSQALMMSMQIKVTPTFCFYRSMNRVRTVTGVNEGNLRNAVKEEMEQIGSGHVPTAR